MLAPLAAMMLAVPPGAAVAAFAAPQARAALGTSLAASALAIGIATLLGVPAGYALTRVAPGARSAVLTLLALPLAFPPVASGIMLLQLFGTQAPLGSWLAAHGVTMVDSLWGVASAQFFVAGSFVAISAAAAFAAIDPLYEESALTLGASRARIFVKVALPLAAPGIGAGIMLAWMRAVGEYGATSVVAYHPASLPVQLYVTLSSQGVGPALSLSYGFVILAALVMGAQWALRRRVV